MAHRSYIETIRRLASANWGEEFETTDDADKKLLESLDLSGACLMRIVRVMDVVIDAIGKHAAKEEVDRCATQLRERAELHINEFIENRERKHGPCPQEVLSAMWQSLHASIGRMFMNGYVQGIPHATVKFNFARGTPEKKAYDSWIRTKVKTKDMPDGVIGKVPPTTGDSHNGR